MDFTYWNELPNELKFLIIQMLDNETRTSLKLCSHRDKTLVEASPSKVLFGCKIMGGELLYFYTSDSVKNWDGPYFLKISTSSSFLATLFQFSMNFSRCDVIEKCLIIPNLNSERSTFWRNDLEKFQFTCSKYFIKIEKLGIKSLKVEDTMRLLTQVDPNVLKELSIRRNSMNIVTGLYDMPQVINVNRLAVVSNCITGEQLLKLKAHEITLYHSKFLTAKDLNRFLKKCYSEINEKNWSFEIDFVHERSWVEDICEGLDIKTSVRYGGKYMVDYLINPLYPQFILEIDIDWGRVIGERTERNLASKPRKTRRQRLRI